jgi:hypothetical protein
VKGNSSSKKLFDPTLEVRQIEMREGSSILVSHMSGERMKAQGTDGVSRGQLKESVSTGRDMLSYILLHLSAIKRSTAVEPWLRSWLSQDDEVLLPDGWFERGHNILGGKQYSKGFCRHLHLGSSSRNSIRGLGRAQEGQNKATGLITCCCHPSVDEARMVPTAL